MSDLYTKLMERVTPVLQQNWRLAIIGGGALFLLGAVFRWKWVRDPQGENTLGFLVFVYRSFGEKGYRIAIGISGAAIILCGMALWALL